MREKKEMVQIKSFREQMALQTCAERRPEICFPDCGKAFQSLGAEVEKVRKSNWCFWCVFQQHLESVDMAAMMSEWVVEERIGEFIYLLYLCTTILSLSQQRIKAGWWLMDQLARAVVL